MKVIDLLNRIANGEEVPKTIIYGTTLKYDEELKDYCNEYEDEYGDSYSDYLFSHQYSVGIILNDEVEVIEEDKKIEKLDVALIGQCDNWLQPTIETDEKIYVEINPYVVDNIRENTINFQRKINEIIDKINKGE